MMFERGGMIGLAAWFVMACGSNAPGPNLVGDGGASSGHSVGGATGAGARWGGTGGTFIFTEGGEAGVGGGASEAGDNLVTFRIEPDAAVLELTVGESGALAYRAFGSFQRAPDVEVELTERTVFHVPDNYLVASFPPDGKGTLTTRLPAAPGDPIQRGGLVTVQAQAANTDGTVSTATTLLTVRLASALEPAPGTPAATPPLPDDWSQHFTGTPDPALAPVLVYPNDGVLMPPNLGRLEIHFERGSPTNTLFEVLFESPSTELRHVTRCHSDPELFEAGACAIMLEGVSLTSLAASNQGQGPLAVTVRGSDEGGSFGQSATFRLEFAEQRIDGAVYYWSASSPESIVRFDFGNAALAPETFVGPADVPGNDGSCVGCHSLSRQGDKMFFSLGNSERGELMYVSDMSRAATDLDRFTYNGAERDQDLPLGQQQNRVLTGSFDPTGAEFVAVAPVNDAEPDQRLWLHDGNTGERKGFVELPFIPSQPDWSPLGDSIAVTAIGGPNDQTISFLGAGISLVQQDRSGWLGQSPVTIVPAAPGKNRFNPAFLPDASLLLYSEVDQSSYSGDHADACDPNGVTPGGSRFCNGYSDPGARTWAVAPEVGAAPVLLANAAAPGVADGRFAVPQLGLGAGGLMDTFPKAAPFLNEHRGNTLGWFTVSSQRRAGLRRSFPNPTVVGDPASQALLWMFAIHPAEVLGGDDGSYPGFFLPFQDLGTSNHMAQWTQRIVSDTPPPPPAPVPPPPAPPPAPRPPIIH